MFVVCVLVSTVMSLKCGRAAHRSVINWLQARVLFSICAYRPNFSMLFAYPLKFGGRGPRVSRINNIVIIFILLGARHLSRLYARPMYWQHFLCPIGTTLSFTSGYIPVSMCMETVLSPCSLAALWTRSLSLCLVTLRQWRRRRERGRQLHRSTPSGWTSTPPGTTLTCSVMM